MANAKIAALRAASPEAPVGPSGPQTLSYPWMTRRGSDLVMPTRPAPSALPPAPPAQPPPGGQPPGGQFPGGQPPVLPPGFRGKSTLPPDVMPGAAPANTKVMQPTLSNNFSMPELDMGRVGPPDMQMPAMSPAQPQASMPGLPPNMQQAASINPVNVDALTKVPGGQVQETVGPPDMPMPAMSPVQQPPVAAPAVAANQPQVSVPPVSAPQVIAPPSDASMIDPAVLQMLDVPQQRTALPNRRPTRRFMF